MPKLPFSGITVISSELMPQQTTVIWRDRYWAQYQQRVERMYWLNKDMIQWEEPKPPMDPDLLLDEGL